jgi:hypothetical protein
LRNDLNDCINVLLICNTLWLPGLLIYTTSNLSGSKRRKIGFDT